MPYPDITLVTETIHNPNEPRHYMRFKPVNRRVRVTRRGQTLAETSHAMRMTEVGRDVYDPIVYFPIADISPSLKPVPGKSTHCPLKGDAHYFALDDDAIAWTYDEPLEFASALKGYVAFYPDEVIVEESGRNSQD